MKILRFSDPHLTLLYLCGFCLLKCYVLGLGHHETSRVVSLLLVWPLIKESKVLIGLISVVVNNCLTWIITPHIKSLGEGIRYTPLLHI